MATFQASSECMAWQAVTDTWAIGRGDFQVVTILHRAAHSITSMVIYFRYNSLGFSSSRMRCHVGIFTLGIIPPEESNFGKPHGIVPIY